MVKQELIDRSPVRFFEKAVNGGLKAGEIGVLTSRKGLGKTSVLVQFGLDMLMQDQTVVHVSFNQHADNVITWYEDIFNEMAKKKNLADAAEVKDAIFRNRVILNFSPDAISASRIVKTLKALAEGGVKANGLIIDGLCLCTLKAADYAELKAYAAEAGLTIWFSYNSDESEAEKILGKEIAAEIATVVCLDQKTDSIQMKVLKAHNTPVQNINLKLDSKSLLISEK